MLGGGGDREVQLRRRARLDPQRDLRVELEEAVDLVALRAQDLVEAIVLARVAALLPEEALDLRAQRRVLDLIEEVLHRANEEPLAVREQHVDAVRDPRRDRATRVPEPGDLGVIDVEVAWRDGHAGSIGTIEKRSIVDLDGTGAPRI